MIWGKYIALFLVSAAVGERGRGSGEGPGERQRPGENEQKDQGRMGRPGEGGERDEMRKEHDSVDLCMFTADDAQCAMVKGCDVISREDYMMMKKKMFGGMGSGKGGMGGSGKGGMGGSGRGSGRGREGGRRRLGMNNMPPKPKGSGSGRGPRGSGSGRGPRGSGSGRGPMKGNMCVSECYFNTVENCPTEGCMVQRKVMYDMKKDDMGKGSGEKKDDMGKGSGNKRPGGRRLMGKGPKGQGGEQQSGRVGGKEGGKGPMQGSGNKRPMPGDKQEGGEQKGPMQGGKDQGKGPMNQSGKGPMNQSGKGPKDQSGKGPMGGSGRGPMGGSGMKRAIAYCGPKMDKELKTGLPVTVTLYTDENCENMLEIPEQRRRLNDEKKGMGEGKKPGSGMMKGEGKMPGSGRMKGEGKMPGSGMKPGSGMQKGSGMKKDMGGNDRQNKRVRENPTTRMIPVVDGLGNPKCSFDAGADRMRGRFRKTTCMQDNALAMDVYDDVLCQHQSEVPGKILFRDECMPLQKREGGDEKKDEGKKGGKDGRRLMEDEKPGMKKGEKMGGGEKMGSGEKKGMMEGMKDKVCNTEINNSLMDWMKGMTCDEEGEDDKKMMEDPCEKLEPAACKKMSKMCALKDNKYCYFAKAPMGQKALFVKYDWSTLMENGEMTDETFCHAEKEPEPEPTDLITSMAQVNKMCDGKEKSMCEGPCQFKAPKLSKKQKNQGMKAVPECIVNKKMVKKGTVKCSKVKDKELCAAFQCELSEGKKAKCSGKVKLDKE